MRENSGTSSTPPEKKKQSGIARREEESMNDNNSTSNGRRATSRSYRGGSAGCKQDKRKVFESYKNGSDDVVRANETSDKPALSISKRDDVGLVLHWGSKKRPRCSVMDELSLVPQKRRTKIASPALVASMHAQTLEKRAQRQVKPFLEMKHSKGGHRGGFSGKDGAGEDRDGLHGQTAPAPCEKQDTVSTRHAQSPAKDFSGHYDGAEAPFLKIELEWPKIVLCLSRMEKEEDFFVIKGTKLPQRPKRRPKAVEKSLLNCSPGIWLSDLSQGRYDIREKKCAKKKTRGLKAMDSIGSDSD